MARNNAKSDAGGVFDLKDIFMADFIINTATYSKSVNTQVLSSFRRESSMLFFSKQDKTSSESMSQESLILAQSQDSSRFFI